MVRNEAWAKSSLLFIFLFLSFRKVKHGKTEAFFARFCPDMHKHDFD